MALFDDELMLRPTFTLGSHQNSEDIYEFIQLVQGFYDEEIFPTLSDTFDYITSTGNPDKIYLDDNTNLNLLGVSDISVHGGIHNVFNQGQDFSIEQIQGETNLYVNDLGNLDGELNLISGNFNLFVENQGDQISQFEIIDNYLHVNDIKQNLLINFTPQSDANLFVYLLNDTDINITELSLGLTSDNQERQENVETDISGNEFQASEAEESSSSSQLDDFIFAEPDVVIQPPAKMEINFDDNILNQVEDYLQVESNELDEFIEKVQSQKTFDLEDGDNDKKVITEDIGVEDLLTISDYEDFVFEDAIELLE